MEDWGEEEGGEKGRGEVRVGGGYCCKRWDRSLRDGILLFRGRFGGVYGLGWEGYDIRYPGY